jgi:alkanesulfonate monooxygenase SsuD/methylene tetrahydromethanopterin reductase-like flavin-dependent oxidoreductase (luciferase family)
MQIYVVLKTATLADLTRDVRRLEDLGVTGVLLTDHLFMDGPDQRRSETSRPNEPMVVLAAVAALSDRLNVGTIVSNIALLHPALVLRQFAQLAALIGGERVLAGLGAGWNRTEFEALGFSMPKHAQRLDRLEQATALARQLFDTGTASMEGSEVVARDLPLSPVVLGAPPRILLGGGSDRLLDIAGRYADVVDLNGSSRSLPVKGKDLPTADTRRELSTTVEHLVYSAERVREAAQTAGRAPDAIRFSTLLNFVTFCSNSQVPDAANAFRRAAGMEDGSVDECPYALLGEPERMRDAVQERRERYDLGAVFIGSQIPWPSVERLCREVFSIAG